MSSGFISERTGEISKPENDEWIKAQQAIDATRTRKPESGKQDGGKTLYEVLEQNKAAKQEAFEESIRLKNQFRNLDEDEVDFLDSILESTRAQEDVVKKETAEQLEAFRKQREAAEKANLDDSIVKDEKPLTQQDELWTAHSSRKRRRAKDSEAVLTGKLRRMSSSNHDVLKSSSASGDIQSPKPKSPDQAEESSGGLATTSKAEESLTTAGPKAPPLASEVPLSLGLGAYNSDDE